MTETMHLGARVAALPEKYQPIFGHPELSEEVRAAAKTGLC